MRQPNALIVATLLLAALGSSAGCDAVGDWLKVSKTQFLDASKVIDKPSRSPINPIWSSVGIADTHQELVPNATLPRDEDYQYAATDYVIGPNDVLDVSILDLFQEGLETVLRRQVSASGYINLPLLPESYDGRIKAEGLTADQLTNAIAAAYSPSVLRDPTVSVTIQVQRQNSFSVRGAVQQPGTYNIVRKDMRLLEALSLAGDVTQPNIPYIYVIRPSPAVRISAEEQEAGRAGEPEPESPAELPPLPEIPNLPETPSAPPEGQAEPQPGTPQQQEWGVEDVLEEFGGLVPGEEPAETPPSGEADLFETVPEEETDNEPGSPFAPGILPMLAEWDDGGPIPGARPKLPPPVEPPATRRGPETPTPPSVRPQTRPEAEEPTEPKAPSDEPAPATAPEPAPPSPDGRSRWVFTDGRWVQVPADQQAPEDADARPGRQEEPVFARGEGADPFGWRDVGKSNMARIIAINRRKLDQGDPRMNIVVRDSDVIMVPTLEVGEFYVMGEVARPGVYSLTGREVTVKMAVAAAGNLGPLAWPENSILIRRVGGNQEQIVPLDIEAIFEGTQPDIFLKPDDVIAVGTDVRTSFFAVMRNAFRMTYGFGFIYDRNFADPFTIPPDVGFNSKRFTRL